MSATLDAKIEGVLQSVATLDIDEKPPQTQQPSVKQDTSSLAVGPMSSAAKNAPRRRRARCDFFLWARNACTDAVGHLDEADLRVSMSDGVRWLRRSRRSST